MKDHIKKIYKTLRLVIKDSDYKKKYELGHSYLNNSFHLDGIAKTNLEISKSPKRYDIINFLLDTFNTKTTYLEIGVRFVEDNFDKILANKKYSVDPGFENRNNPVDFKLTSDAFFNKLSKNEILSRDIKFDVIFIDGLHLAEQVERDIENALHFIKDDGFLVLHDCNPPTNFHASEYYQYRKSPSLDNWNGTTWKAFFKYRLKDNLYSCCIDTDWGIGIISKTKKLGMKSTVSNPFFEYAVLESNRKDSLGLISFNEFKSKL